MKKQNFEVHDEVPVTRRQFLQKGLIGSAAMVAVPTLMGMSIRQAIASSALTVADPALPELPMLVFDMAGGAALAGNFLVGGRGGSEDLLPSYSRLGWDPREAGALDSQFGLPMSLKYSKLREGIVLNSSPAARENFRMGAFMHIAQDDSAGNQMNAAGLVLNATGPGSKIANGMGLRNSSSGGNSAPAVLNAALKPTFITNLNDFLGAVSFGGEPFRGYSLNALRSLAQSTKELGKLQSSMYASLPGGSVLKELADKAYAKGEELIDGAAALDPRTDPVVSSVYKITAQSTADNVDVLGGLITNATLMGLAGPSTYTLGGCDYHTGNHVEGDAKDLAMGVKIGQALELAFRLKRPLFFQLITDGACDANENSRDWKGDSGEKCMTVIGFYHPAGAPKYIRNTPQVGHYTTGQGAERTTLLGGNAQLVACAVFANYLNCMGKLKDFHTFLPDTFKAPGELDSVLIFEGKPA